MTDSGPDGIAETPEPPYVAVIFTSVRTDGDHSEGAGPGPGYIVPPADAGTPNSADGYAVTAAAMDALAAVQPGYLGVESARDGVGITVSYWRDEDAARAWKQVAAHLVAQRRGREVWYRDYRVRVATVHRDYGPSAGGPSEPGPSAGGPSEPGPSEPGPSEPRPSNSGPSGTVPV